MLRELTHLYERALGGPDVAASPDVESSGFWPEGQANVGVSEAKQWIQESLKRGNQFFFFLVGSPGGGKSHISRSIVKDFEEINPKNSNLAERSHLYNAGNQEVLLINDATIKPEEASNCPLAEDMTGCIEAGRSLIACVNRGVFVEEIANSSHLEISQLLKWIQSPVYGTDLDGLDITETTSYLAHGTLRTSSTSVIEICVIYVDACSLFEKPPIVQFKVNELGATSFSGADYQIEKLVSRDDFKVEDTSGTALLASVANLFEPDQNEMWPNTLRFNPIRANLENLRNHVFTRNMGTLLRAAEIVSGQKFSYREVWGVAARSVLGNLTRYVNSENLQRHLEELQPTSANAFERFKSLQKLASLRAHQSLFGIDGTNTTARDEDLDVITNPMSRIDPLIDTLPGQYAVDSPHSGWATWLNDAFAGNDSSSSPLAALRAHSKEFENEDFESVITEFDEQLDQAFADLMNSQDFSEKLFEEIVRWYSSYLTRLYALSKGISAFRSEIATWIDIWRFAPQLPSQVEKKFMTLLRPRISGISSQDSFIPLFDSRTVAISAPPLRPKFAVQLTDLKARTSKAGDNLILALEERSTLVAEMLIDFDLLRAALVCSEDTLGASDVTSSAEPRLERLRAARLTPEMISKQKTFSVVSNLGVESVVISN